MRVLLDECVNEELHKPFPAKIASGSRLPHLPQVRSVGSDRQDWRMTLVSGLRRTNSEK